MKCQYIHGCVRMAGDNAQGLCWFHFDMKFPPNFVGMGEDEDPDAYDKARDRRLTDGG